MASDLFTIGTSGVRAARAALDVTAQNIANASTQGYVRRSVRLSELAAAGGWNRVADLSLSGVRVDGIARNADLFRQAEVRRTSADAGRAGAELTGLQNIESALEQARFYPALTSFEASLRRLSANPVDPSLRTAVLEDARTLTRTFTMAAGGLAEAGSSLRFEAADGVTQVNLAAGELARVNLQLARSQPGTSDHVSLLDHRDTLLQRIADHADVSTSFAANQTVEVRLGGSAGPQLVSGGSTAPLAMTTAADGTIGFTLGAAPLALAGGALAGKAQALGAIASTQTALDGIADSLITTANAVQTGGAALDGTPGQPLFAGSGAAGISLALASGAQIATAPAGAGANSRDPANLDALRAALTSTDIAGQASGLLFTTSSAVAGHKTTSAALSTIANAAQVSLDSQAGVDLDEEAVNLVRYQQAFQASGKAIQVASTLFDTLLALR
ncbi:MAG: flagellar hook-associated protein FlgK [Novosphingobium sp.]|uniref:flagellar hook-associated protein FlgK n=1 Tax=Novosphingobium sp. TaxID=1874826 RepID=UPI0032B71A57